MTKQHISEYQKQKATELMNEATVTVFQGSKSKLKRGVNKFLGVSTLALALAGGTLAVLPQNAQAQVYYTGQQGSYQGAYREYRDVTVTEIDTSRMREEIRARERGLRETSQTAGNIARSLLEGLVERSTYRSDSNSSYIGREIGRDIARNVGYTTMDTIRQGRSNQIYRDVEQNGVALVSFSVSDLNGRTNRIRDIQVRYSDINFQVGDAVTLRVSETGYEIIPQQYSARPSLRR